jgi:hypothetical protein
MLEIMADSYLMTQVPEMTLLIICVCSYHLWNGSNELRFVVYCVRMSIHYAIEQSIPSAHFHCPRQGFLNVPEDNKTTR